MKKSTRKNSDELFIDTSAFKALVDPKDEFHSAAVRIWDSLRNKHNRFITTNYVLDESFTLIRVRCGVQVADIFRHTLLKSPELSIIRVTIDDEASAWKWFMNDWNKLSFTDTVSFAVMTRLNIRRVVTFDKHFSRAGFLMVL
ncbi:hypothetical protein A3B56_01345 [Candidatus Roizmanbacteria bacterium RIFCSPLOWO2_01_FULL_45_11]|uniref:Ribonuclease VapC n=1 Tax=Candidatus Roizmanbacteria bacterium RIFCSPLOWO2_01_FULL_45_11 TaxID=1802070 RepID=A0A1F7JD98_9BACT|nr:MAG: hypothetical protein A3B56_01345 [Candidatus Roizmanbacteria bacterium RIFCSPLOWO2_01_FULL_45_11]